VDSPAQVADAWLAAADFRDRPEWPATRPTFYQLEQNFQVTDFELREEAEVSYYSARGALTLTVNWFQDEEETIEAAEVPFELSLTVAGEFRFTPGREERFARGWLDYNGEYLLWPYARAYVATITGLGRLAKMTIYTSAIPQAPDFESDEDVNSLASSTDQ
jgi:hypothetical protein